MQEDKDRRAARKGRLEEVWEDTRTEGEKPTETDDDFLDRLTNLPTGSESRVWLQLRYCLGHCS